MTAKPSSTAQSDGAVPGDNGIRMPAKYMPNLPGVTDVASQYDYLNGMNFDAAANTAVKTWDPNAPENQLDPVPTLSKVPDVQLVQQDMPAITLDNSSGGEQLPAQEGDHRVFNDGVYRFKLGGNIFNSNLLYSDGPTGDPFRSRLGGNLVLTGVEENDPRFGIGGNGPPPEYTMMTEVFPGLRNAPVSSSILAPIDGFLGISEAAEGANYAATQLQVQSLYNEHRALDPNYRYPDSFQPLEAMSWEGRANYLDQMRQELAVAKFNIQGNIEPLQVETLRFLQKQVDIRYDEAISKYKAGELTTYLGENEAVGNYIDVNVRRDLRILYNQLGVSYAAGQPVRVNSREYDTSGTDRTYKIPDSRVGNIAFDVTLTPKAPGSAQIRGFFSADFAPRAVVIVRPSQLGRNSTYLITRP